MHVYYYFSQSASAKKIDIAFMCDIYYSIKFVVNVLGIFTLSTSVY